MILIKRQRIFVREFDNCSHLATAVKQRSVLNGVRRFVTAEANQQEFKRRDKTLLSL
jgi:hypothetical protein